ncbi:MAG TPA: TolC family protein [Phycisphaerae bacterium]|nr:TolC family protein [Phycisphaerae bacterium]
MARGRFTSWLGMALLAAGGCGGEDMERFTPPPVASLAAVPSGIAPARPTETDAPEPLPPDATLRDYLACAALANPQLQAAFYRWRAAVEQEPQARALPDPRLTYRYFIREVETRVGPQKNAVGLSQTFPWFGKLSLRGEAASEAAQAERNRYEAVKVALFQRVKDAFYDYYYLKQATEVTRENIELLKQVEAVARARYRAGQGAYPDVIRAQVELGKLSDRLETLRELRSPIVARLNATMNRPASAPLPWPGGIVEERMDLDDEQVLACVNEYNPELKALADEEARQRTLIELARKEYYPDVTLGVDYIDVGKSIGGRHPPDDGQDALSVTASLNVPVWRDKYAAGVREARYRRLAAARTREDRANALAAEVKLALYDFHDAGRKIGLYRDTLLPKAQQSYKATLTAYQAGKAEFDAVMDAERVLLDFQLSAERALSDRAKALARIEMLVGRDLPRAGGPAGQGKP